MRAMNPAACRYELRRSITGKPKRPLGVVMLNPSMATEEFVDDATSNDNTIRSLCRIAEHNGFDGIAVTNLSAYRATDPEEFLAAIRGGTDVFGGGNDAIICMMARQCEVVVAAWGATPLKHPALDRRASEVRALLLKYKPVIHCFGKTRTGWPRHPLYLPRATTLQVFATRTP